MRICMYVCFLREKEERRLQIFAQFGGNARYRLVVESKKKEREKKIYFVAIIHWLNENRKKKCKEIYRR